MKLTKQEQMVIIGNMVGFLGEELVNQCIPKEKMERVIPLHNTMNDDTTPRENEKQ
ncbi:hypothetical protein [Bacillus mycoides]|uniref:hypothetical protein n=1 Tax=Bacillus mycoides TaxID=1405 RepID=UPI003DA20465